MSVYQLTEFMLWKSFNKKPSTMNSTIELNITQQNKHEVFENDMICRVCTSPGNISLTERLNDTLIMSALRTVTNIVINEADYYPKHICAKCLEELKISYQFRKKCEATDMMLRAAVSSETTITTDSREMIKHDFTQILHEMKLRRQSSQNVEVKEEVIKEEFPSFDDRDNNLLNNHHKEIKSETDSKFENYYDDTLSIKENYESSGNSSDNEVISSLCKITKIKSLSHSRKKSRNTTNCKIKKKKNSKKKHVLSKPRSIQSRIVNLLEFTSNFETQPVVALKKVNTNKKLLRCKRCDLKFNTKEEFDEHKECEYQSCPKCGKLVLNLMKHEKIMHLRSEKYTCDQCGKIYYSSSALYNHLNVHKTTSEYFCDLCPYKGKRKSYLVSHMRLHTGERRYLCSECPAKFRDISNLKKHQLVHLNKTLECNKCKKMFRDPKTLKQHIDFAHLNIRYRCSICGRELCSRKKLLNHELRVHKREKNKLFDNEEKIIVLSTEK